MGGRGSGGGRGGGGRSGGGGGGANPSELRNKYENDNNAFRTEFMDKYHQMTDDELNRAYRSTQVQMNKARRNLDTELESFNKIREKFSNTDSKDKNFPKISDEFDRQVERVREARTLSDMKTQIHYLALNEKRNIRKK